MRNIPQELIDKMFAAEQGLVPPELRAQGWIYKDMVGRCTPEAWDKLLSIAGEGNYKILISSSGINERGLLWKRGQFLFSPAAVRNFDAYAADATVRVIAPSPAETEAHPETEIETEKGGEP